MTDNKHKFKQFEDKQMDMRERLNARIVELEAELAAIKASQVALSVWYGSMPESNGKSNYTAILHREGECISEGITLDRSEYPDRVRYEADRVRFLIGELSEEPFILDYDADKRSDYDTTPDTGVNDMIVPRDLLVRLNENKLSARCELRALLAQGEQ